jgi:hypothetical protein
LAQSDAGMGRRLVDAQLQAIRPAGPAADFIPGPGVRAPGLFR